MSVYLLENELEALIVVRVHFAQLLVENKNKLFKAAKQLTNKEKLRKKQR